MIGKGALVFRSVLILIFCFAVVGVLDVRGFAGSADMGGVSAKGGSVAVSSGDEALSPSAPGLNPIPVNE
jgi:hypothetical protein